MVCFQKNMNPSLWILLIINGIFSISLGTLWVFIAQSGGFIVGADYITAGVLSLIGFFLQKQTQKNNKKIIPIMFILGFLSCILLLYAYFTIPNYPLSNIPAINIQWLGNMEAHPYGFFFLVIIFCLTNLILLALKFISRIKKTNEVKPENISIYMFFSFLVSILLGYFGTYKTYQFGWLFFFPFDSLFIGLGVFSLYLFYFKYHKDIIDLWIQPKSANELGIKQFLKDSATRDYFLLLAGMVSICISFYINPAGISRSQKVIIFNDLLLFSIPVLIVLLWLLSNLWIAKKIEWFKIVVTQIILCSVLMIPFLYILNFNNPISSHNWLFYVLNGCIFVLSFISLKIISLNRLKDNGGSSWFIDMIWIALPYLLSIISDPAFGSSSIEEFELIFYLLLIIPIIFVVIQIILRRFYVKKEVAEI